MIYLGVEKDQDGNWKIVKQFPNGVNIYGTKTGTLWHSATQMSLQDKIEEGIFLKVNKIQGSDPEFSNMVRTEISFDEEKAEVVYTDIYELIDLETIKSILKDRAFLIRQAACNKTIEFRGEKFSLDSYIMNILNNYSSLIAMGESIPEGAKLPGKHGSSWDLTPELLLEVQTFIAEYNTQIITKFVKVCSDIDAAQTYEDIRLAATWDGDNI